MSLGKSNLKLFVFFIFIDGLVKLVFCYYFCMNIFAKIKYFFLSLKEKSILNNLKNTTKKSYSTNTSKVIYGNAATVTFNSETQKLIDTVKNNVAELVKKTDADPEKLIEYIKTANTSIYYVSNAHKLLAIIGYEEGFISETLGIKALYISLITGQGLKFSTKPMFIMRKGYIEKLYFLHHFYRWYSLRAGLSGFDFLTQEKLKYFLRFNSDDVVKRFSMEEILSLQEAIARDQEATEFVLEYAKQIEGSKKVLEKIKNDGSASV